MSVKINNTTEMVKGLQRWFIPCGHKHEQWCRVLKQTAEVQFPTQKEVSNTIKNDLFDR